MIVRLIVAALLGVVSWSAATAAVTYSFEAFPGSHGGLGYGGNYGHFELTIPKFVDKVDTFSTMVSPTEFATDYGQRVPLSAISSCAFYDRSGQSYACSFQSFKLDSPIYPFSNGVPLDVLIFGVTPPWESQPFTTGMSYFFAAGTFRSLGTFDTLLMPYSAGGRLTISGSNTSIPEPMTWAMMLIGFGVVGSSVRVQRRVLALTN